MACGLCTAIALRLRCLRLWRLLVDKENFYRPLMAGVVGWLAVCSCIGSSVATERPARFAVAGKQIAALGIQTLRLENTTGAVRASEVKANYPAQVTVPPNAEHIVSAPVAGMVTQLLVQQNQTVAKGAPLVRIASPELGQWQLNLLQAHARATLARQAAEREKSLFNEGIIPQRRVQEAQTALATAEAALGQAKSALRLSGMGNAAINRIAASGTLQDTLTLSARQAGIVSEITVKPGQQVDAVTPLLHVMQTDTLWLEIKAPATDRARWQSGALLTVPGHPAVSARLLQGAGTVVAGTQSMTLYAVIEKNDGSLRPGEFVSVELPLELPFKSAQQTANAWDVPLAALAYAGQQAYVFVRTADGFEARPVQVLVSAGQRVRVQGALQAGESIAVAGVVALKGAWLDGGGEP